MDCTRIKRVMSERVGDELPKEVISHLESCAGCKAEFEAVKACMESLRSVGLQGPPEVFWPQQRARVKATLQEEAGERTGSRHVIGFMARPHLITAAALMLLLVVAASIAGHRLFVSTGLYGPIISHVEDSSIPLAVELMDSGVEVSLGLDEEESALVSIIIDSLYSDRGIYLDMYSLEPEELDRLYDSLGYMEEQLRNASNA